MTNRIYLPLSSNLGWFKDKSTQKELECYLKSATVVYDILHLQDGRLHLTAGEDGQGMHFHYPKDSYAGDRTVFDEQPVGSAFGVSIDGRSVMQSTSAFSVNVDFLPIVHSAGMVDMDFISWENLALTQELKWKAESLARSKQFSGSLNKTLPANPYLSKQLLASYYSDATLAYLIKMPFLVDRGTAPLAFELARQNGAVLTASPTDMSLRSWKELAMPDFGEWSWDEILDFRLSASGKDFRKMVSRLSNCIRDGYASGASDREVIDAAKIVLTNELVSELVARRKSVWSVAFGLVLNVIGLNIATVAGGGSDLKQAIKDDRSWTNVLIKHRQKQ